ncbi:MAG TPA: hypothetical protein VLT33_01020 [Labilithrix sp.]|nr:hypothetical protein [Labilithrix sp.]
MKLYESAAVFGLALLALAHQAATRAPPGIELHEAEPPRPPRRTRAAPDHRLRVAVVRAAAAQAALLGS